MNVVASESGATVLQFAELRKELFLPSDPTNAGTNGRLIELARVAAQGIFDELHDEKKAIWKYLSVLESPVSFQGCPKEVKEGLFGREATNDRSKSALGGPPHQLQKYGRIGIVKTLKRYLINYPHLFDYGQTIFCLSFPSRDRATAPGRYEQF